MCSCVYFHIWFLFTCTAHRLKYLVGILYDGTTVFDDNTTDYASKTQILLFTRERSWFLKKKIVCF